MLRPSWRLLLLVCAGGFLHAELKTLKPGFNFFSRQQDIQLGQEAADLVEKTKPVVRNQAVEEYLAKLGGRLAHSPRAGDFPFTFRLIYDKSVNAFALPGGPVFVNTGLLLSVDNEAELAGVLAHEMSHVALRHGTHEASKRNLITLPAALAGAAMGNGMLGQLTQLGVGLGANSVLLRFSRAAESQADYNGVQMMADAGYNPIELARFFERLEGDSKGSLPFLSDHPNPGNRMKAISDELRDLPQRSYDADTGDFDRIRAIVKNLKPPDKSAPAAPAAPQEGNPPSGLRLYSSGAYSLRYPAGWRVFEASSSITIAPGAGLIQNESGRTVVGYGMIVSFFYPDDGIDLERNTRELISQLRAQDASMKVVGGPQKVRAGGTDGLETVLAARQSAKGGNQGQIDTLVTVARPQGLFYLVFVAPEDQFRQAQSVYETIVQSLTFP